jgi:hypothetical protein
MASPLDRGGRIVLGLALIALGIGIVGGVMGWVMAVAGLLPLTLGSSTDASWPPSESPVQGSDLPSSICLTGARADARGGSSLLLP